MLDEIADLLERSQFLLSLGKVDQGKKTCLEAVKKLNDLSKKDSDIPRNVIKEVSQYALKVYDSNMTTNDKIIWLNSKVNKETIYPVLRFGGLSSTDQLFSKEHEEEELLLPINAKYEKINDSTWSLNHTDLINLYQDKLSNCSFVSSFLSLVHSGNESKLFDIITPHGPSEYYNVSLRFNGAVRKVTIDNKLPILGDKSRSITIRSSSDQNLFWPALIEKAYLKVMGQGYSFEGSNMASDTYTLTGWIPEIIYIKDGRMPNTNYELCKKYGHLTSLGIGTGKISKQLSEKTGFISNHDYVLLKGMENEDLTIINPWLENEDCRKIIHNNRNELFQFNYLYVNWDMDSIFKYKTTINFIYNGQGLDTKPQFTISNPTDEPQDMWVFLERFISKNDAAVISMDLYESGFKVISPDQYNSLSVGKVTNSHFDLLRITMEPNSSKTLLVNCSITTSMSLTLFNNVSSELGLTRAKAKYGKVVKFDDEWDFTNGGGENTYSTYLKNPQFDIEVTDSTDVFITLESNQVSTFHMFYWNEQDKNKSMREFKSGDLLIDPPYLSGTQSCHLNHLEPGFYRIICSCRDPETRDKFKLSVYHCEGEIKISKVINPLGLFMERITFDWNNMNRNKIPFSLKTYQNKLSFHIQHSSNNFTKAEKVVTYRPNMRASIFSLDTSQPVKVNEEWNNSIYGIFFDCQINNPGNFVLLVERFEPGVGTVEINFGCNNRLYI
ncbi:calpain-like protease palB/RIM13 [[Candida] jaroonii]|uniref:Calpain-like protease palB/RIM13 n=1 Tax=[Candida] jaroonii TaxID=467808 RepID=A0ACA9Y182_9ASCO|nr:calpain-like protease palB/RIM13 [[Candida] jaroonii]